MKNVLIDLVCEDYDAAEINFNSCLIIIYLLPCLRSDLGQKLPYNYSGRRASRGGVRRLKNTPGDPEGLHCAPRL